MGKKLYFLTSLYHLSHLSSCIYPFCLFSSSSFFLPFIPPLPFFALYAAAHHMNPKCSHAIFTKSSDFSRSRGEWRMVVVCGDISKAAFSYCYRPSPTPPLFFFFFIQPSFLLSSLRATDISGVVVQCEDREGGGTIDRVSIVSGEMLHCDKAKPALAESCPDLCCSLASAQLW